MAQFKKSNEYPARLLDPAQSEPGVEDFVYTEATPAKKDAMLKVVFKVQVAEGILELPMEGTEDMLNEILKRYGTEGLSLTNQHGFTWYPPHAIRKVDVLS